MSPSRHQVIGSLDELSVLRTNQGGSRGILLLFYPSIITFKKDRADKLRMFVMNVPAAVLPHGWYYLLSKVCESDW